MPEGRYHHGSLRTALLSRAEEVLREDGVGALSLRRLARDMGVSHAAPGRHFADKRALLDALAVAGFERLTTALERAGRRGRSFRGRVRAMAAAYVEFATTEADLLDLMFAGKHSPDASAELLAAGERMGDAALGIVRDGQHSGDVRQGDPERIGLVLLAAVHGVAGMLTSGMVPAGVRDRMLTDVVDTVVRGVAPRA
ncbi:MAG: TetR/AcrR family transcriptional regulator [Streptosporangiales bacterium]|nr:TetR/AcrR family transcriptional regulator [Streptosporangiales bacterium]MBO0892530.1 TetR/AcrR family transcriptional regulator [Acidothermales bacterium]